MTPQAKSASLDPPETPAGLDRFHDRAHAGRLLAERLREYAGRDDVVVLGLPRGGVPVAFEIGRALDAPLDVFLVRKLGVPGREEYALGAIATGGVRVLDRQLIESIGLPAEWLEALDAKERRELDRRERAYRGDRPPPDLAGRTAILVDDGLATGSTMLAAVHAVRADDPARVIVAVPVGDPDVCEGLGEVADEVVCLLTPRPLRAVGLWYENFDQTPDGAVRDLLDRARRPPPVRAPADLHPLRGELSDYDALIERALDARYVLLGEASHGTQEFYRERAEITMRLIAEAGFTAVAVEADWPDAYRVNRYVRGAGDDETAEEALRDFRRFPNWMWRNTEVAEFVTLLREFNDALAPAAQKVGFYGLDLYSLYSSMDAVVKYLDDVDPAAAERARERYACFDQFGRDPQVYAYEAGIAGAEPCERQAIEQLLELRDLASEGDGQLDADRQFFAEQNARLVANAEQYHRAMFRAGQNGWNLRDGHMAETLDELVAHLERTSGPTKVVAWAWRMSWPRLSWPARACSVARWSPRCELCAHTSWEELFHEQELSRYWLHTADLPGRRLERAIGVIYRPETERLSHYFHARIAEQFDAVIHIDETHALEPLEPTSEWVAGELPETYPSGV